MARRTTRADKEPTKVSIVYDFLRHTDDFVTAQQIASALESQGITPNHVSASLHHLRKYKAAECMESDGQLWWYPTPDSDTRSKQVEARRPEDKPRAARRPRGSVKS